MSFVPSNHLHPKLVLPWHSNVVFLHGVEMRVDWKNHHESIFGLVHQHGSGHHHVQCWRFLVLQIELVVPKHEVSMPICVEEHAILRIGEWFWKFNLLEEHICPIAQVVEYLTRILVQRHREHVVFNIFLGKYRMVRLVPHRRLLQKIHLVLDLVFAILVVGFHLESICDAIFHYAIGAFGSSPPPSNPLPIFVGNQQRIFAIDPWGLEIRIVLANQVVFYVLRTDESMLLLHMILHHFRKHLSHHASHLVEILQKIRQWVQEFPFGFGEVRNMLHHIVVWLPAVF